MKLKKLKKTTKVKIESKGEYLLLMELAEKAGYKWNSEHEPTFFNDNEDYFNTHEITLYDNMVIRCMTSYSKTAQADTDAVSLKKVIKFEVGDKVRIRKDLDKCYKSEGPGMTLGMIDCVGDVYEIRGINAHRNPKWYDLKGNPYWWFKKWIEPVLPEVEEEHKCYNGKIIFTKGDEIFKTGHIYEIMDGRIKRPDSGETLPVLRCAFESIDDVRKYFKAKTMNGWSHETLKLMEVQDD